jgi:hypothetical protein
MNIEQKFYQPQYPIKKVTIIYTFNNSKFGFNNSITVEAINDDQALDKARYEVSGAYGSKMLPRFSFKLK